MPQPEDREHIEGLTLTQANEAIAHIDAADGNPKKGVFGVGAQHLEAACDAWLAGDRLGPPPPGITKTWAIPVEKWDDPGNHAVPLRPQHVTVLLGKRLDGGPPVTRGQMKQRSRAEENAWRRPE